MSEVPSKEQRAKALHFMKTLIRMWLHINWDEAAMQARSQHKNRDDEK